MKIIYDANLDIVRIQLNNERIYVSDEVKPSIILDFDQNGNVLGMEILDASKRISNPKSMEYAIV